MKEIRNYRLSRGAELHKVGWQTIIDAYSDDLRNAEDRVRELSEGKKKGDKAEKGAKLAKKLALARLLLISRIKHMHERGETDAKFFVELVRLLQESEGLLGAYDDELQVWNEFLTVLLDKMKAEKLIVYSKWKGGPADFEREKYDFNAPIEKKSED